MVSPTYTGDIKWKNEFDFKQPSY